MFTALRFWTSCMISHSASLSLSPPSPTSTLTLGTMRSKATEFGPQCLKLKGVWKHYHDMLFKDTTQKPVVPGISADHFGFGKPKKMMWLFHIINDHLSKVVDPSKLHQKMENPNDQTLPPSAAKYLGSFTMAPSCELFVLREELTIPKEKCITESQRSIVLVPM